MSGEPDNGSCSNSKWLVAGTYKKFIYMYVGTLNDKVGNFIKRESEMIF